MRTRVASVLAVAALVGCSPHPDAGSSGGGQAGSGTSGGGASAGGSGAQGGTGGGASGSSGAASGGSAGAGVAGSAGANATNPSHYGQVLVQSLTRTGSGVTVSARFVSDAPASTSVCTSQEDGPCRVTTCDMSAGTATSSYASAGTVTISSPDVMGTATLTASPDGSYATPTQMFFDSSFKGGELLQFKAEGSMVPAFSGELNVPLVLLFTQPAFASGQVTLEAPRAEDLALTWTRGAAGVSLYVIGASTRPDGQAGTASIYCNFPSEPGSGVIKSSLLQQLKPDAQLNLLTVASKAITAGDYSVTLGATMPAANPDKAILPNITLK